MIINEHFTLNGVPQAGLTTPSITIYEDGIDSKETVADLVVENVSSPNATFSSIGSNLPTLEVDDLKYISGATNAGNNGLWKITSIVTAGDEVTAEKLDGLTPVNETSFAGVFSDLPVDEPIDEYGNGWYYYDWSNLSYNQLKKYTVLFDGTATITNASERYKSKDIGYHPI